MKYLFSLIVLVIIPLISRAETPQEKPVSQSELATLASDPFWRALLHYEETWSSPPHSIFKNSSLFLATDGAYNAQSELSATLQAFFSPANTRIREQHPQCVYRARFHWLKEKLPKLFSELTEIQCPEFDKWWAGLQPNHATLIFSSAFMNNPASMFGHTFLRLDHDDDESPALLSYAANYAAELQGDPGLVFAIKGVFGGYRGYFSVGPYYDKVKKYNDFENRDLWEYSLSLTPEEVRRIGEHLWELQGIGSPYYYFDENCSYHLLSLLEVGRPGLHLFKKLGLWVIPSDTLRAITEEPGIIAKVNFRPAPTTILRYKASSLSPNEIAQALALARGESSPTSLPNDPEARAHILELASEYLEYLRLQGKTSREDSASRFRALLIERSKLSAELLAPPPAPSVPPEAGHHSLRLTLSSGVEHAHPFVQWGARAAYHDLLDPDGGFIRGAGISLGDIQLRSYLDDSKSPGVILQRATLLSIASLSPRSALFSPLSWTFKVEGEQLLGVDHRDHFTPSLDLGLGRSYDLTKSSLFYALLKGRVEFATNYSSNTDPEGGLEFGLLSDLSATTKLLTQSHILATHADSGAPNRGASLAVQQTLSTNDAVVLESSYENRFQHDSITTMLSWRWYY